MLHDTVHRQIPIQNGQINERRTVVQSRSFFDSRLLKPDPTLDALLEASSAAGLPPYEITPLQGKFLHLLVQLQRARRILEIGTLGGYSSVWLARALPENGRLVTLEIDPEHARVARANFDRVGLSECIELRVGDALDSLATLHASNCVPFDFIFIDADKKRNVEYFSWALKLGHPGSLIVVDNVVRNGEIVDQDSNDPSVDGIRKLAELIEREPNISATALQTVGRKGYDGFLIAIVNDEPSPEE